MSSLKYWVWLSSVSGVGPVTAGKLLSRFDTPEKIFFAQPEEYKDIEDIKPFELTGLSSKNIGKANNILSDCEQNGFRVITLQDAEYPDRLKNIYDPPVVLYIRGKLPVIDEEAAVAIAGTRSCTPYGIKEAERLGYELARHGLLVVSGLARGVDSAAARGALRGGGRVLGVIGSGLDVVYPSENVSLFEDVSAMGAILSEYPPGMRALPGNFPMRNRILSGVALGVAIIEAPKNSGALITAARALEQGRDVFAMPGNVDSPACEGSNRLLREGAIPLLSGENIAEEYEPLFPEKITVAARSRMVPLDGKSADRLVKKYIDDDKNSREPSKIEIDNTSGVEYIDLDKILSILTGDEKTVAEAIGGRSVHVDEIILTSGLPAQNVLTALTMLELGGFAVQSGGKYFSLTQPE